jgi:AcrR family transcriptional regulator
MRVASRDKGDSEPAGERLARPSAPPPTRDTRAFAQKRSHATYDALLDASASVFADKGFDATQTPDIARRAGVSVGTFYRYFADKRQAFIEVVHASFEQSYDTVMANLTPEAFAVTRTPDARRAAVEHVIDVLFQNAAERPGLHFVFLAMSMRDPDVARIRTEFEERGRDAMATLIEGIVPRARIADPLAAAEVIQIAAQEVAIATFGGRGAPAHTERAGALRAALADMLYRYVFGEN